MLGCYSATPRTFTNPTSQVLEINGHLLLIDCGEGTQVQLRKNKIRFSRINHIFISHLHGDHFFGLPGLIASFQMLNRVNDLHIYGPKGIKKAITLLLKLSNSWTAYTLIFHELTKMEPELIFEDFKIEVHTIPLQHRVYCNGFLIKEKQGERKLNIGKVLNYNIDVALYKSIKRGKDVVDAEGKLILNKELTEDPDPIKSYAFCSDTRYDEVKITQLFGVTALYHEATFLESHKHLCERTGHSTAKQAATIAKKSKVENLILGHYSTRYKDLSLFKQEAQTIFENSDTADDGKVFEF